MISVHFQGKSFSITVSQVYTPTNNAKVYPYEEPIPIGGNTIVMSPQEEGVNGRKQLEK